MRTAPRSVKDATSSIKAADAQPMAPTSNAKPAWVAPPIPRAPGTGATGATAGNFDLGGMTSIGVNPGQNGAGDVADDTAEDLAG